MKASSEAVLPIPQALIEEMRKTEQNPKYHAEGNVLNHTLMVLETFQADKEKFLLDESDEKVLYWAAILHDVGKPRVTKWVGGRWKAKGHEEAGIPIARNILLQRPDISPVQRRRILDLVKYHSIPLQWGLYHRPMADYKHLATRTDLRMLGIFAYFDIQGRDCVGKENVLGIIQNFNEHIYPQVQYEMGTFDDIQSTYQKASHQKKNALWQATKFEDIKLVEKLLKATPQQMSLPSARCVMTLSKINSPLKAAHVSAHYGDFVRYEADLLPLDYADKHDKENQLRQMKHFISVYSRGKKNMLLDGSFLHVETRVYMMEYARNLGAHIQYLFFEEEDDATHRPMLDYPHPWEAHTVEVIQASVGA